MFRYIIHTLFSPLNCIFYWASLLCRTSISYPCACKCISIWRHMPGIYTRQAYIYMAVGSGKGEILSKKNNIRTGVSVVNNISSLSFFYLPRTLPLKQLNYYIFHICVGGFLGFSMSPMCCVLTCSNKIENSNKKYQ